ncbi:MAG TPA: IS66 family transposase [Longimicrobium sp.]|nr:IS66 family transposase [Longimicrobium sp.]
MSHVEQLKAAGEALSPAICAVIEGLEAAITLLQERVRELEARLAQNSTNSSQPPSSDGPGVVRERKKPTGKKRGGQKGHRGHHRKLLGPERVDEVVIHRADECGHCGHDLACAKEARPAYVHQVVELPAIRTQVVEHRMVCVRCPKCRKLTRGKLPAEVGGKHFGPRLAALGSLLAGHYRLSRRSTVDLLGRLLDVPPPSLGSTESFTQETSAALAEAYGQIKAEVRRSEWAGVDETQWKECGKKRWLWIAVAKQATLFHLGKSRGSEELSGFLGGDYRGIVSSDRWCAYRIYTLRQVCWAHLVRSFKRLGLRGGKAEEFAAQGERICALVFRKHREMEEGRLGREQFWIDMQPIRRRLRRLIERGEKSIDRRVAGTSRNLLKLWPSLWTFLDQPVELTNNAAERALRAAVLWRKSCFGNQSEPGMRYAERILSVGATCRQQRTHPLDFLALSVSALRSGTAAPKILPAH